MDVTQTGVPRRRLTQAEARQRTREQLLASAARVFIQKGFARASLEEIAESAGYSTGALYYNFKNKEELLLELLKTGWSQDIERRVSAVSEAFNAGAAEASDPFEALSRYVVKLADQHREIAPLQAESWLYAIRNPEGREVFRAKLREQVEGLEPIIAAAMKRYGADGDISPKEMTTVAVLLLDGMVRQRSLDPQAIPDDLFARVVRRLVTGRITRSAGESE